MKRLNSALTALAASVALAGGVRMEERTITLPTYAPGGYDKTPAFCTGRVCQGAQEGFCPCPTQDVLHDGKMDETYTCLTMENDWLQFGLLPEHGGRLLDLTDRKTGFEAFCRQHALTPARIGMFGAWFSGGVEWNFPHHRRATTAMPVDWKLVRDKKTGKKAIWIGATELRRRLKWSIGLSLLPDRAVLQAENVFMNRGPYVESMIYWANVSVHCGAGDQAVFPSGGHLGFDRHKAFWTSFPMDPKKDGHMVACWSGNQPDDSRIDPYETRTAKQFWFPVKGIGGVKDVTVDGAVNVERLEKKEELLVGFHSTRVLQGCTVRVLRAGASEPVFEEKKVAIDPDTPWCKTVKVPADAKDQELTATLADASGAVFLAYTPVGPGPHAPQPPKAANPKEPQACTSAEEAYLTGLRLDQFHNGLVDPVPYYERALALDPGYAAATVALATRLAKNAEYAKAEKLLRTAVARVTRNDTRAKDAAPEYLLAVVLEEQGHAARGPAERAAKFKEAEDLYWRATGRSALARPAYAGLARLACLRGDWAEARARVDDALDRGAKEAKLHVMRAYVLRQLKDLTASAKELRLAAAVDPLDAWGVAERAFLEDDGADAAVNAGENRGIKVQVLLETVCDYWSLGAWREVAALCDQANALAAREKPLRTEGALPPKEALAACASCRNPLFDYFGGAALELMGRADLAKERYARAAAQPTDSCFPNRHEECAVLKRAAALCPGLALQPGHARARRNVGFGFAHPGTSFTDAGVPSGVPGEEARPPLGRLQGPAEAGNAAK